MSVSNFDFSYPPPTVTNIQYTEHQQGQTQHHQWTWASQQYLQSFVTAVPPYPPNAQVRTHFPHPPPPLPARPHGHHSTAPPSRHFSPRGRPPQTWSRTNYKRTRRDSGDSSEPKSKILKKKKRPLSQNVPTRKDWNIQDAEHALSLEKDYNKRFKNHSLIIKFPDPELNKEIVTKFHEAIENVHFQQPSTARFCFVTLKESVDASVIIQALNKKPFGNGHLVVEYKKDREDEQPITAEDIDPLTLYVGNLAQEITKEDMVKAFPRCRRIDIGYAKKMKYTRYAFVTFKKVTDSLEAFKQTHSTEMYSKSLIVRFRRLHGTVGMPGESKLQNPPKSRSEEQPTTSRDVPADFDEYEHAPRYYSTAINYPLPPYPLPPYPLPPYPVQAPPINPPLPPDPEPEPFKPEPPEDEDVKPPNSSSYESPFVPGPIDNKFMRHRPKIKTEVKNEIKTENDPSDADNSSINNQNNVKGERIDTIEIKEEPYEEEEFDINDDYYEFFESDSSEEENELDRPIDFDQLYQNMENQANVLSSLREKDPP